MRYINKTRFLILTATLTLLFSFLTIYAKYMSNDLACSVVRLHIIANSNTDTDQQLKLKVRDRILRESPSLFATTHTPETALRYAEENIPRIKEIAEDEIRKHGFGYTANVKVGKYPFPTKTYGDIMFPAGSYNAVRIEIGTARGENWWCVMYPPLCFTKETVNANEENRKKLESVLSKSTYDLVTGQDSGAVPVQVRFKIVEIFQQLF